MKEIYTTTMFLDFSGVSGILFPACGKNMRVSTVSSRKFS
jgi:hypothetical protein